MSKRSYGIGQIAKISGVSQRTLRFYEEAGLLVPAREPNGYRRYTDEDVDRLQEILILRHLGMSVREIPRALESAPGDRVEALGRHLDALKAERAGLDELIRTVEDTIEHLEKGAPMRNEDKFEGMKRDIVEENERTYGAEARSRWGDDAVDASKRKMLNLSESEFARFQELQTEINEALESAVRAGSDPTGPEGARMCALHREWLGFTWNFYTPEAHRGLAEMYVADERFTSFYDGTVPGCAAWLRDAIVTWAK